MGNIPFQPSEQSGRSGGIDVSVNADAFGAAQGRALSQFGEAIGDAGRPISEFFRDQNKESVASILAGSSYTPRYLELQKNAVAGGEGLTKAVDADYDAHVSGLVDQAAAKGVSSAGQREIRETLLGRKPGVIGQAATYEANQREDYSRLQANDGLAAITNRVRSDPTSWQTAAEDSDKVIDARPDLSASAKAEMKIKNRQQLAGSRFEAMSAGATTPAQLDGIEAELKKPEWQERIEPGRFDRLLDGISRGREALRTKADASARATLETLTERNTKQVRIPDAELQAAEKEIGSSGNPTLQWKFAAIKEQQSIYKNMPGLPPSTVAAERRKLNDAAAGTMPARLDNAFADATARTGVPTSYLAGTAHAEYGMYLGRRSGDGSGYISYANQGKTRDRPLSVKLTGALSFLKDMGVTAEVFSGGQAAAGEGGKRTGSTRHDHGDAADVFFYQNGRRLSWANDADRPIFQEIVRRGRGAGLTGFGAGPGYMQEGSMHIGFGKGGVWGAGGVGAAAPLWLRQAFGDPRAAHGNDSVDYGRGTADGSTSAVGVFQFTKGGWDAVGPRVAAQFGLDWASMSEDQRLDMRKNPEYSAVGAGFTAKDNAAYFRNVFKRDPTDGELYSAHLLGAGGAETLVNAINTRPDAIAADLLPEAAKNNKGVFKNADGSNRTVKQVMDALEAKFGGGQSRVDYTRTEAMDNVQKRQIEGLREDPISYAAEGGRFGVGSLDDADSFAARGRQAKAIGRYYEVADADMKPFTKSEAAELTRTIKDGTADQVLDIMSKVDAMGGEIGRSAMKQLGEADPLFERAASLYASGNVNGMATAGDVIRGEKRLKENPALEKALGSNDDRQAEFDRVAGSSMAFMSGRATQSVMDAAKAHYAETYGSRNPVFDRTAFQSSLQAVLGGTTDAPKVAPVNGTLTVLPTGITADEFNTAIDRMSPGDYTAMSVDGQPPRYGNGAPVPADEIAAEGVFRAIGGDHYQIELGDGKRAVSRLDADRRPIWYTMKMDTETLRRLGRTQAMPDVDVRSSMSGGM